jgi:Kef-type K+ transport system membrane component KefB
MTLSKTQTYVTIGAGLTVILAFMFAGILWAAGTHFETIAAHNVSMELAASSFDKALKTEAAREIKREIRRLEYREKKGIITDQELYELQGLYQELKDLS